MKQPAKIFVVGLGMAYGGVEIAHTWNDPGNTKRDQLAATALTTAGDTGSVRFFTDTVSGLEVAVNWPPRSPEIEEG